MRTSLFHFAALAPLLLFSCVSAGSGGDARRNPAYADLASLPPDSGGAQKAYPRGSTDSPYGFQLYLPAGYARTEAPYPLLVFLHGSGELEERDDPSSIRNVLRQGPPLLIWLKAWKPRFPLIVASPQCQAEDGAWLPGKLKAFIDYLQRAYRVNPRRIYLTGLSMGGIGVFDYLSSESGADIAAAVPVCGDGDPGKAALIGRVPIWAFHGELDTVVPVAGVKAVIAAVNALNPPVRAKLTLYPLLGHECWEPTYDGSGKWLVDPQRDPYDESLCDWLLRYRRGEANGE